MWQSNGERFEPQKNSTAYCEHKASCMRGCSVCMRGNKVHLRGCMHGPWVHREAHLPKGVGLTTRAVCKHMEQQPRNRFVVSSKMRNHACQHRLQANNGYQPQSYDQVSKTQPITRAVALRLFLPATRGDGQMLQKPAMRVSCMRATMSCVIARDFPNGDIVSRSQSAVAWLSSVFSTWLS